MKFFKQLVLLIWKNLLLKRNRKWAAVFEIIIPLFGTYLVATWKHSDEISEIQNAVLYQPVSVYLELPSIDRFLFVPNTTLAKTIVSETVKRLASHMTSSAPALQGMNDESELQDYAVTTDRREWAAVMFTNLGQNTTLPQHVAFSLSSPHWTAFPFPFKRALILPILESPEDDLSLSRSHLALQSLLTETLISMWSGKNVSFELTTNNMPYPSRWGGRGRGGRIWGNTLRMPELLVVSFILSVVQATKDVVVEKENKIKESMKLMGMLPSAYWASWFVSFSACVAIVTLVCAAFMCTTIVAPVPFLDHVDSVYCVFLLCFAAALVSYGIMMSVFFTR
ncbi:hypothetical protein BaRGS_00040469, partial [Batillaria attramentaria]